MNYYRQLQKVTDFIGDHLDEEMTLESLSEIACLSKFHFHRMFTALTGLSLLQYIKWLRLKRAAHQLIWDKEQSIITTAINAGFDSHEAFSRAFKNACGLSPSQYRLEGNLAYWTKPPYCLPKKDGDDMKVEIRQINKIRLAVVEHKDDPLKVGESVSKLINWAKNQTINLKPKPGEAFGIAYSDPKITPAADFKMDLGLKIPENLKLQGEVVEKYLPAGRYAMVMHEGSRDNLGDSIYPLYRDWLPTSGEQLGDLPCVCCYHNFDDEVADTKLLTEIRLLLRDR